MATAKKIQKEKPKTSLSGAAPSTFDRLEAWLAARSRFFFIFLSFLFALFALVLFNARVSEGGDDSTYVLAGWEYAKNFFHYYYSFNAPFYPMFLSLPIKVFGINLIALKFISLLFGFFGFLIFYRTFKGRVPYLILIPVLFFMAVSSSLQYFSSQTYNEAFFMFWQALFLFSFIKLYDAVNFEGANLRTTWKQWLFFGVMAFVLTFTKNIAVCMVPALALFFILNKRWKEAGLAILSFAAVRVAYEGIKAVIWGNLAQYKSQGSILLLKDPYDASKGNDDIAGFIGRFFENCNIYLSKRFFQILGFRSEKGTELYAGLAFIVIVFIIIGLVAIFRSKNKIFLFASLYTLSITAGTFVVLQARWDQPRMILIHMPIILMIIFFGIYFLVRKASFGQNIYLALVFLICGSVLVSSLKRTASNIPILSRNLRGDIYYGYTPDWVNFLKMSRWCADSLPESSYVASRKAPMSFIYGKGKKFFPVYKVLAYDTATHQSNPDTLLAIFRKEKVTHMLIASIRMNPEENNGNVINTLHNMIAPLMQKYPQKVVLVHQEGDSEPAQLYEIKQ